MQVDAIGYLHQCDLTHIQKTCQLQSQLHNGFRAFIGHRPFDLSFNGLN